MLMTILIGFASILGPNLRTPVEISKVCAVGMVALKDLPSINNAPRSETFYNGRTDQYHRDLFEICPQLVKHLPTGFKLATEPVFRRVRELTNKTQVSIFDVEVPKLNGDSTRATVEMGYYCNGLCGARFRASYILTDKGWERVGKPEMTAVS